MAWDKSTLAFRISWLEERLRESRKIKVAKESKTTTQASTTFLLMFKKNTPHFAFEKLGFFFLAKLTGAKEPWEHFFNF